MNTNKKLVNVRLNIALIEQIKLAAQQLDITVSQFFRLALKEKLSRIDADKGDG